MKESFMRRAKVLGVGTLFAVGLTTSASALNYKIGDVDLRVDINTSAGVSVRVADRNDKLLPTVNGGPTDSRVIFKFGTGAATGAASAQIGARSFGTPLSCMDNGAVICNKNGPTTADGAYAGSINSDDSRLNWDRGDLRLVPLKQLSISMRVQATGRISCASTLSKTSYWTAIAVPREQQLDLTPSRTQFVMLNSWTPLFPMMAKLVRAPIRLKLVAKCLTGVNQPLFLAATPCLTRST